jgi:tetratricopeptide (TPR) repeat protein
MAFLLICLFALPLKSQNKTEALIDSLLDIYFEVSNSDREFALKLAERAQKLARENADKHNEAVALECLGVQYYYRGDYQKARNLLQQSLDIYHKENSSRGLASVFTNLD